MKSVIPKLVLNAVLLGAAATFTWAQESPTAPADSQSAETSPGWDVAPKFKRARGLPPLYPMSYIQGRKSGWAVVSYTVGVDGRAKNVVLESSSDAKFGKHLAAAIRIWPHYPAKKAGVPVEATVTRKFSLEWE